MFRMSGIVMYYPLFSLRTQHYETMESKDSMMVYRESINWRPTKHQVVPEFMYSEAEDSVNYAPDVKYLRRSTVKPLKSALKNNNRSSANLPSTPTEVVATAPEYKSNLVSCK
jgi:hypothetical protein